MKLDARLDLASLFLRGFGALAHPRLGLLDADNPGQNAPRSAPVADEPRGRPTGRQPGVGIGGSTPRPRRDLQLQGRAQGSGNRPPTPMVCPDCHHSVFSNNTICVHCACEAARKVMVGPRPPTPPLQRQQRPPHGLQGRWSPAYLRWSSTARWDNSKAGRPEDRPRSRTHVPAFWGRRRKIQCPAPASPSPRGGGEPSRSSPSPSPRPRRTCARRAMSISAAPTASYASPAPPRGRPSRRPRALLNPTISAPLGHNNNSNLLRPSMPARRSSSSSSSSSKWRN